jgi:hypothetical protein
MLDGQLDGFSMLQITRSVEENLTVSAHGCLDLREV